MNYIAGYTGWNPTVNRVILDSSTFTFGENAIKSDELDSGGKRTRLKSDAPSDKYSVTMEFNWIVKDENGKTELQRFYEWYKYDHRYGSVPFEFPKILYSPNSGIKYIDDKSYAYQSEYYKITSAAECSKVGECVQVKMTWETVYAGVITYSEESITDSDVVIYPKNGYVDIYFAKLPPTIPTSNSIALTIKNSNSEVMTSNMIVQGIYFDNTNTLRVFYPTLSNPDTYKMDLVMNITVNGELLSISKSAQYKVGL